MRTSTSADSNASATVAYTKPWLAEPVAAARLCPAADRDTPEDSVRSSAPSIAATIDGAVHPVTPAKQTLTMRPTLSSNCADKRSCRADRAGVLAWTDAGR